MASIYLTTSLLGLSLILSACGGSGSGTSNSSTEDSSSKTTTYQTQRDSVYKTSSIENNTCTAGGVKIELGIDTNGNGILDSTEVDTARTKVVCHGQSGAEGKDGFTTLFKVIALASEECEYGGRKLIAGLDVNKDNALNDDEITQSELLCNAMVTVTQPASLIDTVDEAAGLNCSNGGTKILTGLDISSNLVLDADEVNETSYICNGEDGIDVSDDEFLISSVKEPFGKNCFHGGYAHSVGRDSNGDGILQAEEVSSTSYSCNDNSAPIVHFTGDLQAIPGYPVEVKVYAEDFSQYGKDDVDLSITNKPDWLTITEINNNTLKLTGTAEGELGDEFTIDVEATDTDLSTESSVNISITDGVYVSLASDDILEGNPTTSQPYKMTESSISLNLSEELDQPLTVSGQIISAHSSGFPKVVSADGHNRRYFEVRFELGQTEKTLDLLVPTDDRYELTESFYIELYSTQYEGSKTVQLEKTKEVVIENDDLTEVTFNSEQPNEFQIAFSQWGYEENLSIDLVNSPTWLAISNSIQSGCNNYACVDGQSHSLSGEPPASAIGQTFNLIADISLLNRSFQKELSITVTEGDRDNDGVLNSDDAFPDNNQYHLDTDADGLADQWELNYFGDLNLTDGSGDRDADGVSDQNEFLDGTAPAADSDGDGIADLVDAYPENPGFSQDKDEDGLADEWELAYFESLAFVDANSDFDRDGLADIDEFILSTNPKLADSDNDGVTDENDAFPIDDDYSEDTDGDGLADAWELMYFASLTEASSETDSDSDGLLDIEEFQSGSLAIPDADDDGIADRFDAFPSNDAYQNDHDDDGIADKWEIRISGFSEYCATNPNDSQCINQYCNSEAGQNNQACSFYECRYSAYSFCPDFLVLSVFSAETDYDVDQSSDLQEFIVDSDPTLFDGTLVFGSEQSNDLIFYRSPSKHKTLGLAANTPSWISSSCIQQSCSTISLSGNPSVDQIGSSGSFEVSLNGKLRTVQYEVVEGDTDSDGVLNSEDAFPTNSSAQTDSDGDGLGDEWELANFESLDLADASSDFDNNGITDKQAFENDTPINDLSFDFESGEIPNGWVNTGDVNWIVSDQHAYEGDYALTIEQPLAPGQSAIIEFDIETQKGNLRLLTSHLEQNRPNGNLTLSGDWVHLPSSSYWDSYNKSFASGSYSIVLQYENDSSTHNAPKIYIDNLHGLVGVIPADRDGDGVLNSEDLYPDRSDAATDSDNDGIGDEWEKQYFGTLDRVNATSDFDEDGLLDIDEFTFSVNPSSTDSDHDGVSDGDDAFPDDSRYHADTDNDGLADSWERTYFSSIDVANSETDSDKDGVLDLIEFSEGTLAAVDSDSDGHPDILDPFPDNASYQYDQDSDGIADEWEVQYARISSFSETGDYDSDGRNDLMEFLNGTNPTEKNLTAVEDILTVAQGHTIPLDLVSNDVSPQPSISVISVEAPDANLGIVSEMSAGNYNFTAGDDYLGWVRLNYTASDGVSDSIGAVFVRITAQTPPQIVKIEGGNGYSMALYSDGYLYSWGSNNYGSLGLGDTEPRAVPTKVTSIASIKDFVVGNYGKTYALTDMGEVWRWGRDYGSTPVQTNDTDVQAIAKGGYLLKADGKVYRHGSLQSGGLMSIKQIAAGSQHLLMLDDMGNVWARGYNGYGQLGDGSNIDQTSPVAVSKLSNIRTIEANQYQSFAIDNNGDLYAWGQNDSGQLGDGTYTKRNVPVQVESLTNVQSVSSGSGHTLILLEDGQLYGMGRNYERQLATLSSGSTPRRIGQDISLIGTGRYFSLIVDEENIAFGFGSNSSGQLGDGTTQDRSQPTEISWLREAAISELGKESFEWGRIPPYWRNSGGNWYVVNNDAIDGDYSIRVQDRLDDYESASLGFQVTTAAGDMSFQVKTSTEPDFDVLAFKIDGVEQDLQAYNSSGENDWTISSNFSLDAGLHSFEWVYVKDGGTSNGHDTVWLDDIRIPMDSDADGVLDHVDSEPYNPMHP